MIPSLKQINIFLDYLKNVQNFSLSRFNDGEMIAIERSSAYTARGDQECTEELSYALKNSLSYSKPGYWVGLPCSLCYSHHRRIAENLVKTEQKTLAVVLTNSNWKKVTDQFFSIVNIRPVVWVSGEDQKLDKLALNIQEHIKVPSKNSFSKFAEVLSNVDRFKSDDLIILSCGPLSRVLAQRWWDIRTDCTFLDVGSLFDPFTRNVRHRCHIWNNGKNNVNFCGECNSYE